MKIYLIVILFLAISCSTQPCRTIDTSDAPPEILNPTPKANVFIFKYDGTKQCGEGREISLEAMSKQLQNIKIISMSKKNDGKIRIQVCGAATGQANVYEISSSDLNKAKSFGFEEWKINN